MHPISAALSDRRLDLKDDEETESFAASIENPLTNVVNPQPKRMQIEEMEEELRTGKVAKERIGDKAAEIAGLYADIGQREKAIDFLRRAIRATTPPDVSLLNRLAGYYGDIKNYEREEEIYREAGKVSTWSGTWFNLSLTLKRQGRLPEAREAVDQAISLDREAPYLVQAALIARANGDESESNTLLAEAMATFDPVRSLSDWELGWFVTAARTLDDQPKLSQGCEEQKRRTRGTKRTDVEGELPIATPGMLRPKT